jgi:glycosyltransferase involved in cell wall biosynthesis
MTLPVNFKKPAPDLIPSPLLSITIPTCNRADFLDYCLEVHIPLARAHNIQIFVSDNASTDATKEVVEKRQLEYPLIRYHRNETNLGPDENFERALKYPKTEYVWLLGDTYQIPAEGISYLIGLITEKKQNYDMFLFNIGDEIKDVPTKDYTDHNNLLLDMCWLMTCISCLVYSSQLIMNADFKRYRNTNFIQTGIIFEYIANQAFTIHWEENLSVTRWSNTKNLVKKSWQSQTFEIWAKNRTSFIFSLPPSYELHNKLKCAMYDRYNLMFPLKGLVGLRNENYLNYKIFQQYSYLFPLTIKYSKLTILIIALLPIGILRILKATIKSVNRPK